MPRYKLTIEYDGGPFVGWQRQENGRSVQQAIEEAVAAFSGETVGGQGRRPHRRRRPCPRPGRPSRPRARLAGRHGPRRASTPISGPSRSRSSPPSGWPTISTRASRRVKRHYLYRISDRRAPPALDARPASGHVPTPLDAEAMHEAAQALVGKHDFTTFRAAECQARSPVKTLDRLDVSREGGEIAVRASARSFLHSQVRSMVGALKKVGEGKWPVADGRRGACRPRPRPRRARSRRRTASTSSPSTTERAQMPTSRSTDWAMARLTHEVGDDERRRRSRRRRRARGGRSGNCSGGRRRASPPRSGRRRCRRRAARGRRGGR